MTYVDGFLLPLPKKNLKAYTKMAKTASKIWLDHGALEYRECIGDDLENKMCLPFTKSVAAKKGETVVFSWVVYKSRAHRDKTNAKIMSDPRMLEMMKQKPPFDCSRMFFGGFKTLIAADKR